jgi:hypothetical protein
MSSIQASSEGGTLQDVIAGGAQLLARPAAGAQLAQVGDMAVQVPVLTPSSWATLMMLASGCCVNAATVLAPMASQSRG